MKNKRNLKAKWAVLVFSFLMLGVQKVKADERLTPIANKKSAASKGVLGHPSEELLKRYGKPTAVSFLSDSPPNKSRVPEGVPLLSSQTPLWAQAVALSLKGRQGAMIWLYKRNGKAASYLIDPLGYVDVACVAGSETPNAVRNQEFEVSTLPSVSLGEPLRNVIARYGYPDQTRILAGGITELTYPSKTKPQEHQDVYATVFTVHDDKVVRVYSYGYLPGPPSRSPEAQSGQFFLLEPQ